MKAIYKYRIESDRHEPIEMPKGAKVLSVGMQGTDIFFWAEVDTVTDEKEKRYFIVYETGHRINDELNLKYVGTIVNENTILITTFHVFHIYEVLNTHKETA